MPDPMTSPSQEVKPLPCPACGSSTAQRAISCPLWQVVCDMRDGGCGLSSRFADTREEAVRYWNRRRELESRVSPGVAPETNNEPPDESYGNQVGKYGFIRTIGGSYMLVDETEEGRPLARFVNQSAAEEVGRFMARLEAKALLAPSSAPEEATDQCANCGHTAVMHGQLQGKGSTWCIAPASGERAAPFKTICNCEKFVASRSSGEDQPSKLTSEELAEAGITREELDERIAAIGRGEGIPHVDAVARVRERIEQASPQPAPPPVRGWSSPIEEEGRVAQPAEPTGATMGATELGLNARIGMLERTIERMKALMGEILEAAHQRTKAGREVTRESGSAYGGYIITREGDLVDMRDDIERIIRRAAPDLVKSAWEKHYPRPVASHTAEPDPSAEAKPHG